MRFKRISVSNLFSFDHAEFPLSAYTVMVGPNNSGKTNLLRILDMVSKSENLEYIEICRMHKFDPDKPSEITLTMVLDESEARMAFQCIFGLKSPIGEVSEEMTALDVTVFWGGEPLETIYPKLTLYRFGSGFVIAVSSSGQNIAFNVGGIFATHEDYANEVNSWKAADPKNMFESIINRLGSSNYVELEDGSSFVDAILDGGFDSTQCNVAIYLPMQINYNPNNDTPIIRLVKGRKYQDSFSTVPAGMVFNRIFEEGFTVVREIYPSIKDLSNSLAVLRNSHNDRYADMCDAFEKISSGIKVLVERDGNGEEQIMFVENGRRYGIGVSASGYYALTSILSKLLGRESGVVAIDEPEIHLHPEMSSRLHSMLDEMARRGRVQIVVVTHSTRFVTYGQIQGTDKSNLIMVSRQGSASEAHTDMTGTTPSIKPHMFNPEIFFGKGSMIVEGPSDYFVQRAISDFYGKVFEKYNIVLVSCGGKSILDDQGELHRRFNIPYHGMADEDYEGNLEHVTRLEGDLEKSLMRIGVECVKVKENFRVYSKMMKFLNDSENEEWKNKSNIWLAFTEAVREAGGIIPPQEDSGARHQRESSLDAMHHAVP